MSDPTGNQSNGQPDQPDSSGGQPPAYPPPGQQPSPYGQPPQGQQPSYSEQYAQSPYGQQGYGQPAYGQPAYGQPGYGVDPNKRPGTVTAAGVTTLISSGLMLLLSAIVIIGAVAARETFVDQVAGQPGMENINPDDVVSFVVVVFVIAAIWSVLAMILAGFALRRSNGARIGLVVSAALTAILSLISITSIVSLLPLVAAVATIVCLFAGGAGAWFSRSSDSGGGGWQSSPVA